MKLRRILLLVLVLAAVGGGVGFYLHQKNGDEAIDTALTVVVKKHDFKVEVTDTGKIEARERVSIKSRVAGEVKEVDVDEGAHVKKGQLLLRIDPVPFQREVERADAQVAQIQQAIDYAHITLARRKQAVDDKAAAQAELDAAENELKVQEATLKGARVQLSSAQDQLHFTDIRAPLDGTVIERGIQAGEMVTPGVQATFDGKALLVVADLSTLRVRVELNQIDVAKLELGQTVTVTLDALPGKSWDAVVTKIAPAAQKSGDRDVFPVEATLKVADAAVRPGMSADVRILIETHAGSIAVPIEAIEKDAGKSYVHVVVDKDGKKSTDRKEVQVGKSNDKEIEIASGIAEGDTLLIQPGSAKANEAKM
jgi:RND family efflux transporter MFP subunit